MIRAFAAWGGVKEYQLVIAGSAGFGASEVDQTIEQQHMKERVRMLGFVSEQELPLLYQGARAFVFPSEAEGFGLPVLQAMAVGLPTVASDIPALREVVGESTLLIDPKNESQWTVALEQITRDETLGASLQAKGIARAAEFSWEKTAQLTWEGIRNLVE